MYHPLPPIGQHRSYRYFRNTCCTSCTSSRNYLPRPCTRRKHRCCFLARRPGQARWTQRMCQQLHARMINWQCLSGAVRTIQMGGNADAVMRMHDVDEHAYTLYRALCGMNNRDQPIPSSPCVGSWSHASLGRLRIHMGSCTSRPLSFGTRQSSCICPIPFQMRSGCPAIP